MISISSTEELRAFCKRAMDHPFVTVDTEFLRERTYYAQLCLIQMALPGAEGAEDDAVLVDALAEGLDLTPIYDLFRAPDVTKVFHAARQDLEIFYQAAGIIPAPLFDTQVAAMVCGYGEQVGYETLVRRICQTGLDKSSRFTDWSRRPLSEKQKSYAIADVTHLRDIYLKLSGQLEESGRASWLHEEIDILTSPETYDLQPEDAWRRVKTRSSSPRFLATVRELAATRERLAQTRDVPRNRIFKDDVILELAATRPTKVEDLTRSRLLQREARKGDVAAEILAAVKRAADVPAEALPEAPKQPERRAGSEALADLMRVLLKARAEEFGVAQKLIATASDLDTLVAGDAESPILRGWRREVFGADAERLRNGHIALSAQGQKIQIIEL